MKIKLIDCMAEERTVEFGTCDLCMGVGNAEFRTFTFEDVATGRHFDAEAQMWEYGDLWHASGVDNLFVFAEWLLNNEVSDYNDAEDGYYWLCEVIDAYIDWRIIEVNMERWEYKRMLSERVYN